MPMKDVKDVPPVRKPYGVMRDGILWNGPTVGRLEGVEEVGGASTVVELMERAWREFGPMPAVGQRQILYRRYVTAPDSSRKYEKLTLGEYAFTTYSQYRDQVMQLGAGLMSFARLRRGDRILLYAETRREWMLACLAGFSQSLTVATVYTTLGEDGLMHGLAQTKAKLVLTDESLLPSVSRALTSSHGTMRSCKHVAYTPQSMAGSDPAADKVLRIAVGVLNGARWKVESTDGIASRGRLHPHDPCPPSATDTALIMFTSGTTGAPKGVMLSHSNLVHAVVGCEDRVRTYLPPGQSLAGEVYLAYLPLAHSMELTLELAFLAAGVTVGYGSPQTLTRHSAKMDDSDIESEPEAPEETPHDTETDAPNDEEAGESKAAGTSGTGGVDRPAGGGAGGRKGHGKNSAATGLVGVRRSSPGDAEALRPTFMMVAPAVVDRLMTAVEEGVSRRGRADRAVFEMALAAGRANWRRGGVGAGWPLDRMAFAPVQEMLGGRIRFIGSGAAPLSPRAQVWLQTVLNAPTRQGYGLTETCATSCMQVGCDNSVCVVGPPTSTCCVKLLDWSSYRVADAWDPDVQAPRGEILIGGPTVCEGYLVAHGEKGAAEMQQKNKDDFSVDDTGMRWFHTGDIGSITPDGNLQIIDRKKDLVKLQNGEYVALSKVESVLCNCPVVDLSLVHARPTESFVVALLVPTRQELAETGKRLGCSDLTPDRLCQDPKVEEEVLEQVKSACEGKLAPCEIPRRVALVPEPWTPDNTTVSSALKIRRNAVYAEHAGLIERMYESGHHK